MEKRETDSDLLSEEDLYIKHFSHEHRLKLIEPNYGHPSKRAAYIRSSRLCNACNKFCQSTDRYECSSCSYKLHKSCSELPQKLLNPYHPHTLYAEVRQGQRTNVQCSACCRKIARPGFFYRCLYCNLILGVCCITLKPAGDIFHYFGHFHPLIKYEPASAVTSSRYSCAVCSSLSACDTSFTGSAYSCMDCCFFVHQHCSELKLPQQMQHPCHPYLLTLTPILTSSHESSSQSVTLYYHCESCEFKTDVGSALRLYSNKFEGKKQLYHFSHRHPLALREQNNEDDQVNCSACTKPCLAPTYGCITCQFFLHQSCVDLPLEIQHFFHPCPLTLRIQQNSLNCGACDTTIQGFYYYCLWCSFSMDIECALLPTIKSQSQEQFYHFRHGHPLTLTEIRNDERICCFACGRFCSGSAFVCSKCDFFLDKSCFDLAREIQHNFHPCHPLILQVKPTKLKPVCSVCCKNLNGMIYCCEQCDFGMHMKCTQLKRTGSYKGHDHLLVFLEDIDIEVECNRCETPCCSSVFHCLECNFNLHFLCGPLPCKITHKCHHHPFILTDSPLEDESDQFYCDICEKKRDPRLSVYYCKECQFPAEIKCLMPEVMCTLNGDYGDVELRTTAGQITGKVIGKSEEVTELETKEEQTNDRGIEGSENKPVLTWDDVLISFNEDENKELQGVLAASRPKSEKSEVSLFSCSDLLITYSADENMEMESVLAAQGKGKVWGCETSSNDQKVESDKNLKVSLFSDRAYKHFMEKLDSTTNYSSLTLWEGNKEVVDVGGNIVVPEYFSPILQEVRAKYGDVSVNSRLSPRVKNYFIVMLCGTLHSMCNTRIIDISENLLLNWWKNLKTLESAKFRVDFAIGRLKEVLRAYFGLQVEKAVAELDKKMTNLSQIIEKSTRELKALKEIHECVALAKASRSSTINDCLEKASTQKWRRAGAGLL